MTPEELVIALENKGITEGSYCTYKRTYDRTCAVHYIGRLKKVSRFGIFISKIIELTKYNVTSSIKLNYDNIQFISKATNAEKTLYKLLKNP